MATGKRFYWLKLKRDFFKRHDIRIIESMPNGKDYILFYLKLLVESIDHDGALRFSDTVPYNEQMLSVITNTNVDVVRSAMKVFVELKLIDVLDDRTIYMAEVQRMIGSETDYAEQKKLQRKEKNALKGVDNVHTDVHSMSTQCPKSVHTEKDIEKDKDKDKDILSSCNDELYLERSAPAHTHAHEDNPAPTAEDVIHAYNDACVCLPPLRYITDIERSAAEAILQKYTLDQLKEAFCRVEASDLLTGRKEGATWRANFMWIVKEERIKDILNGKYDSWRKPPIKPTPATDSNSTFDVDDFYARTIEHTYGKVDAG